LSCPARVLVDVAPPSGITATAGAVNPTPSGAALEGKWGHEKTSGLVQDTWVQNLRKFLLIRAACGFLKKVWSVVFELSGSMV